MISNGRKRRHGITKELQYNIHQQHEYTAVHQNTCLANNENLGTLHVHP